MNCLGLYNQSFKDLDLNLGFKIKEMLLKPARKTIYYFKIDSICIFALEKVLVSTALRDNPTELASEIHGMTGYLASEDVGDRIMSIGVPSHFLGISLVLINAPAAAAAAKSLQSCPTLCDPIDTQPQPSVRVEPPELTRSAAS